mmetsp:Transcript_79295/g.116222  ORF Transcript_79295/g.116222 Transcript_79295/m.116222 type:complete len:97 (-) Transcript_79295:500-790(-)
MQVMQLMLLMLPLTFMEVVLKVVQGGDAKACIPRVLLRCNCLPPTLSLSVPWIGETEAGPAPIHFRAPPLVLSPRAKLSVSLAAAAAAAAGPILAP